MCKHFSKQQVQSIKIVHRQAQSVETTKNMIVYVAKKLDMKLRKFSFQGEFQIQIKH